jgi:hypothetical protein
VSSSPRDEEATIGIDSAGNAASIRMMGATVLSFAIRGDAAAEYQIDGRIRNGNWKENVGSEYTGSSDYNDQVTTGWHEVRIRCSSGTAGSGDESTITLSTGGGG